MEAKKPVGFGSSPPEPIGEARCPIHNPYVIGRLRAPLTIDPEPDPAIFTRPLRHFPESEWPQERGKNWRGTGYRIRNMGTGAEYANARDAAEQLQISAWRIANACKRGMPVGGVRLEYVRK